MWNSHQQREPQAEAMEACVLNINNMNLTPPQKELLHWHFCLCHQGSDSLQRLLRTGYLGNSPLTCAAAKCDIPTCSVCEFAKPKHRPTTTKQQLPVSSKTHALKRDQLYPGQWVSMDYFMVTEHGRTLAAVFLSIMQQGMFMLNTCSVSPQQKHCRPRLDTKSAWQTWGSQFKPIKLTMAFLPHVLS